VIPDAFAQNPDRMTRFHRESQVPASLNHPQHLAPIYGVDNGPASPKPTEGNLHVTLW